MAAVRRARQGRTGRAFWLKQLHTWHWVSSAICLIGLLLFTVTGITLNHAADIEGNPVTSEQRATLAGALRPLVKVSAEEAEATDPVKKPLPPPVAAWAGETFGIRGAGVAEWSPDEIYLPLPRPGGDGWMTIDRESGEAVMEVTDRGWISWLNDLHKGRNAGVVWTWFIDIFAGACLIFAFTGLFLLQLHARKRPITWPLVGFGLLIPAIIAAYFIH